MFRTILIVFVSYLLIRFISGIWRVRKVIKKNMDDVSSSSNRGSGKADGQVHIHKTKTKKDKDSDEGTYVDYEEIE